MRKSLRNKLTGSMMLAVLASLVIVSVCLLLGVSRYSSTRFKNDMSNVFTTDLLVEMNAAADGSVSSAATDVQQILDAHAGQLGIGSGREYTIWDADTGDYLIGTLETAAMTDNTVTAMNGFVGDAVPLFAAKMDMAIPITGDDVTLVVDIQDDGSAMRSLCWNILLLLLAAAALSLIMSLLLSRIMASAFADSAVQTARAIREDANQTMQPTGDWMPLALALCEPKRPGGRNAPAPDTAAVLAPYLTEGLVQFTSDGTITHINDAAQRLLRTRQTEELRFEQLFPGVPIPNETQRMVHGRFTQANDRLDVVFLALEDGTFAALVQPVEGAFT